MRTSCLCASLYLPVSSVFFADYFNNGKPMAFQGLKPQHIDRLLPHGLVATRQWVLEQGVSRHALDNAVKSHRLHKLAVGVYARAESRLSWQAVVCSLQRMADRSVLVGGVSALQVLGLGQYLSFGDTQKLHLYAEGKVPGWLGRVAAKASFQWHSTRMLWGAEVLENKTYQKHLQWRDDLPEIALSCSEKAYLEMLADIPDGISFDHADELMQGLTSLSPSKLDALLRGCKSIKVKRLFFWLASRHNYPWFRKLNRDDYDLGKGKRVIAKSGKLDNTYLITVPEHLHGPK